MKLKSNFDASFLYKKL